MSTEELRRGLHPPRTMPVKPPILGLVLRGTLVQMISTMSGLLERTLPLDDFKSVMRLRG